MKYTRLPMPMMTSDTHMTDLRTDPALFYQLLFLSFSFSLLYLLSRYSFLLFHTLAELLGVGVALGIFFITWNTRKNIDSQYFLYIGINHLFIAIVAILHTLAYKGMNIFAGYDADLPTQLWIAGGYLQCLTFLGASLLHKQKINAHYHFAMVALFTTLMVFTIFKGWFPSCFIEGTGLTPFKKVSEIVICLGLLGAAITLRQKPIVLDRTLVLQLTAALVANSLSRFAFIFYVSVYGLSNLVGHLFYLVYIYFIYRVILEQGLVKPHNVLYSRLQDKKEKLKQSEKVLEQKIAERTRELEQANASLTAINKELQDFAYIVSHDLREPLRGIHNFASILEQENADKLDPEGKYMLETITRLAQRQESMIASILHYTGLSRKDLEPSEVDLNQLIAEVCDNLQLDTRKPEVEIRIPERLPVIQHDRIFVFQIFSNLISNGIKFNDKEVKWVEITAMAGQNDTNPVFAIRDNGIGIPERHHDKIFTIFKRLHRKDAFGGGTGVGLAIVKNIINRHGGEIWFESEVGRGTSFFFSLPPIDKSGKAAQ